MNWVEMWRWLLYLGIGLFAVLSVYVIIMGARDAVRLLRD